MLWKFKSRLLYIIIALIVTNLLSQVHPAVLVALLTTALFLVGVCYGSTYDETTCYCADHERFANDSTLRNLIWKQNREYGMSAQIYKPQGTIPIYRMGFFFKIWPQNHGHFPCNSKFCWQAFEWGWTLLTVFSTLAHSQKTVELSTLAW